MIFKNFHRPVIIIGMHRSGTSMLARVLHRAGIHMGAHRDHNFEAMHFLSINQRAMWASGADWDRPVVPDEANFDQWSARELYAIHFQIRNRAQYIFCRMTDCSWGWKDPRNTFTLPHWLKVFPKARVVHLVRHGWDVALSLSRRNQVPGEVYSSMLDDPLNGFRLWNVYITQAMKYTNCQILHIRYEDLLEFDINTISRLEHFLERKLKIHLEKVLRKTLVRNVHYPIEIVENEWIKKFYPH